MRLAVVVVLAVVLMTASIVSADKTKIETTQTTVVAINSSNIILLIALKVC